MPRVRAVRSFTRLRHACHDEPRQTFMLPDLPVRHTPQSNPLGRANAGFVCNHSGDRSRYGHQWCRARSSSPERQTTRTRRRDPRGQPPETARPEAMGAFSLTLVAAGGELLAALTKGEVSTAAKVVAPGLVVMALIY